jgi:hypothetical protein
VVQGKLSRGGEGMYRLIQILITGFIAFVTITVAVNANGLLQLGILWAALTAAFIILAEA